MSILKKGTTKEKTLREKRAPKKGFSAPTDNTAAPYAHESQINPGGPAPYAVDKNR
jgi:hypothetical protein